MAFAALGRALGFICRSALDILAPRACGACPHIGVEGVYCPGCRTDTAPSAQRAAPTLVQGLPVFAAGAFAPPLSLAIKHFKYAGRSDLAEPLAELWWQRWQPAIAPRTQQTVGDVVLIPVPLHPQRLVERGYNQSALLAACLARLARARVAHGVIERVHATGQQARLRANERAHNLHGAFRASALGRVPPGTRLVLVDDVVTTGATLAACQVACRAANLNLSAVWALAHTARTTRDA
ncbi:MAG TPA: ComF family protein [Polyangiaceae bacterium]|nr:ComF family protein [Polyangiaceae bacterium]